MAYPIERREIDERLVRRSHVVCELVDERDRTMRQKDGPGLRAQLDHVPRAVVFLVLAGALVLLDDVAVVFGKRVARRHARLAVAVRVQMIEIQRGLGFLYQRCIVLQGAISFGGGAIDDVAMRIRAGGKINLGP